MPPRASPRSLRERHPDDRLERPRDVHDDLKTTVQRKKRLGDAQPLVGRVIERALKPLFSGRFPTPADNENVLYVLKSDGKGGVMIQAIKSPAGVGRTGEPQEIFRGQKTDVVSP